MPCKRPNRALRLEARKFLPIHVVRELLNGRKYGDLTVAEKIIADRAMAVPPFGRCYSVSLWMGCVEVVTVDKAAELAIARRENGGVVTGKDGPWPLKMKCEH